MFWLVNLRFVVAYLDSQIPCKKNVPKVGIEPTLPKEHDFESCASTSSATLAIKAKIRSFSNKIIALNLDSP